MKSQIATNIEQSKRLIEAGLDPESCDMWWTIRRPLKYDGWKLVYNGEPYVYLSTYKEEPIALAEFEIVSAWSLSKLIDICDGALLRSECGSVEMIESLVNAICFLISTGDIDKKYLR